MNLTGNREPETDMRSVTAPDRRLFRTQGFLQGPVFRGLPTLAWTG